MLFYRESLGLPDSTFTLLRDLIHEKTGIYYNENSKEILIDKLSERVIELGLNSFLDYYYLLRYDDENQNEIRIVFNLITVNETYFFRELDQLKALCESIIPEQVKKYPSEKLKIWCAACSTGEEPLSIAILLNEADWFNRANIEILATDASSIAISHAVNGLYRERSFRNCPEAIKEKYFIQTNGVYRINPLIHSRVKFDTLNLLDSEGIKPYAASRNIFCRNVFIYFSDDKIRETVMNFYHSMPSDSFLFVGVSESLLKYKLPLKFTEIDKSFAYYKP